MAQSWKSWAKHVREVETGTSGEVINKCLPRVTIRQLMAGFRAGIESSTNQSMCRVARLALVDLSRA